MNRYYVLRQGYGAEAVDADCFLIENHGVLIFKIGPRIIMAYREWTKVEEKK
jgi:hypothetical protein